MEQDNSQQPDTPRANRQESQASYVIGADIGGTSLRLALADGQGAIKGRWCTPVAGTRDANSVVGLIRQGVDTLLGQASLPSRALCAMAAGAPGITDAHKGTVIATSYLMGWRDVPLREILEAEFGVPVSVENDVNLAALGEHHAGAARGVSDFAFLAIGTGVGAGIILNGRLHRGNMWTAGEIGYMLVPGTSPEPVGRGEPGALEGIVGGEGIKAQWQNRWSKDLTTFPRDVTATQIFDFALAGDSLARNILQLASRTLGYAIYNMSLVLNCPLFVLGGSVGIHPALGDAARLVLGQQNARVQPNLVCSALGTDAQLIGTIVAALEVAHNRPACKGR